MGLNGMLHLVSRWITFGGEEMSSFLTVRCGASSDLIFRVKNYVVTIKTVWTVNSRISGQRDSHDEDGQIRWIPPRPGEVALNCDGSVTGLGAIATYGGVLRDDLGNFICGYAVNLGSCSILEAELWSILHGLSIAWNRGFRRIQVYLDSKIAVGLLSEGCYKTNACHALVKAIQDVHAGSGEILWKHTYREANQVADVLAKFGLSLDDQVRFFYVPPSFVCNALRVDAGGTFFPRGF